MSFSLLKPYGHKTTSSFICLTARHQAAKIEAVDLMRVVTVAFCDLAREALFWLLSPQTLNTRLDTVLRKLGIFP